MLFKKRKSDGFLHLMALLATLPLCTFFSGIFADTRGLRVITFGGAICDIYLQCPVSQMSMRQSSDKKSFLMFDEGTKVEVSNLRYDIGGGAVNVACGLTKMGIQTSAFFKTGDDHAAEFIRSSLKERGVDTTLSVISEKIPTGSSFILPSPTGNNTILVYRGANTTIEAVECPLTAMSDINGLYIAPISGMTATLLPFLVKNAPESVLIMHNPSKYELSEASTILLESLPYIDILMCNESELATLAQQINKSKRAFCIKTFCKEIIDQGVKIVVVTHGAHGVYCATDKKFYHHSSLSVNVVNSVGAGDAFGAAFFGSILTGCSIEKALKFGIINSASILSNSQGHNGLLSFNELESRAVAISNTMLTIEEI